MRRISLFLAAGLLAAALSGCNGGPAEPAGEPDDHAYPAIASRAGVLDQEEDGFLTADPAGAVAAIYEGLETARIDPVGLDELEEVFGLASYMIVDAVAYLSDVTGGLCDVVIVKPAPNMTEQVRETLSQFTVMRAASFRNYDILGAYSIASNAVVFNQGEYVVMLMLPDNDAAREIINLYIPH
ncbi:MAG: DUF4358 domain-containing protein [Oscillospiraceae bacterium]|nr:DUF4358 domain-containing protein [Oscillospiraceae bacterium]